MPCEKNKKTSKSKDKFYKLSLNDTVKNMWKKDPRLRALKRKMFPARPVEEVFIGMLENSRILKRQGDIYQDFKIVEILDKVIPHKYFGSTQNRKRFYHLVNKITTQSRFERVPSTVLAEGYDLEVIDWLNKENLTKNKKKSLLYKANLYTLKYIVKPIIKHMYYPLKSHHGYKISFIEKNRWYSFNQKIFNDLSASNYIIPSDLPHSYCRGNLRLCPKKNCDNLEYRPLICSHKKSMEMKLKIRSLSKGLTSLALKYSLISTGSLYLKWKEFVNNSEDQQIFGIKMDIADAFGNVDVQIVCDLIEKSTLFNRSDKELLRNRLLNQFVCYNNKLFKWTHGILQGDSLSPSICNLYLSFVEYKYQIEAFRENCFLTRYVDDYLFCSLNSVNIKMFENKIKSAFSVNEDKTERIEFTNGNDNSNNTLSYYGQIFNLNTKEVSKFYKFDKDDCIRYKFNFWTNKFPKNRLDIIERSLKFMFNNHCFKNIELNTCFNTEITVLKNYFEGMIYIAYKFDAGVNYFVNFKETGNDMDLCQTVKNTVHQYAAISLSVIKKFKGKYFTGNITFTLLLNIGYVAFKLVLERRFKFYSSIIDCIKTKNLYLKFEEIDSKEFFKLPESLRCINISRKSPI